MALAAGIASASAQVYSANVVGYYNVTVPANGYALVANQLTNSANNDINVVLASGFKSDVNAVQNTTLYLWTGSTYNIYQYFTGADADNWFVLSGSVNGWYDSVGNLASAQFKQGTGSFIYNPSGTAITNTIVGQVPQGNFSRTIKTGFDTYSVIPPISTNIDSTIGFPGTSDVNGNNNDTIYIYNPGVGYSIFQYFTGSDADNWFVLSGSVNGWYDSVGNLASSKQKVGQGFFLRHFTAPVTWNSSFTVQ
ncbi:MAG: hypothetical protein U1F65_01775 [Verrucomicrobiota bacterium]